MGSVATGIILSRVTLASVVIAVAGLIVVLAVARYWYDGAVAAALLLLGFVRIDPAPVDGVFLGVLAVAAATGRLRVSAVPRWALLAMGAFVACNVLSLIDVLDAGRAAVYLGITVYVLVLAAWVPGYVDSTARARRVLSCYLVVAVASAVVATLALYASFPGSTDLTNHFGDRARGLFRDSNVYAPFLIPAAVLLLAELVEPRLLRLTRSVKLLLIAVLVVGIFTAYSRAAWLNLAVATLVMLAGARVRFGAARRMGVALLALVIAFSAAGATVLATGSGGVVARRAKLIQFYDHDRFHAQHRALELATHHPVGIGPGQFEDRSSVSTHDTYLRALAEQGVLGLAAVLVLLLGTLVAAVRNALSGPDSFGFSSIALLAIWCGLLVNSLFVDTLHWRNLWIFAGLIWAGALARRRAQEPAPLELEPFVPVPRVAEPVGAVLVARHGRGRVALAMSGLVVGGALLAGLLRDRAR